MIVNTLRLLARIQAGYRTKDPETLICAESCLSFLVLHLKMDTLVLPQALYPHYEKLPDPWTTPTQPGSLIPAIPGKSQ